MRNFNKINYHQEQAVNAWVNQNFKGTIMLAPGLGKTFTSFHAAYRLLELGRINLLKTNSKVKSPGKSRSGEFGTTI